MASKNGTKGTYTYRGGKRVELQKRPDAFVVRELPHNLPRSLGEAERVSGSSTRVWVDPTELEARMKAARELAPTHHAYERADTGSEFLITDRIIITFKKAPTVQDLGKFLAKYALQVAQTYSDREFLLRLTDQTNQNPVKLVVQLQEQESALLESVDHDLNVVASVRAVALPTDAAYQRQWHLHQRQATATDYDPRSSARCEEAWQVLGGFGSNDVVVGITDDGCQIDHPDFDGGSKFAGWAYFVANTLVRFGDPGASASNMYQSGANHGTSCAGVIAAEIDGAMTVGAAPGVRILPIKWESNGSSLFVSDSKLRMAIDHLADKADVVSNSWGSTPITTWSTSLVNRIRALAQNGGRRGKGMIFLWAAGNENCPIAHNAAQDVPYTDGWNDTGTAWIGVDTTRTFTNSLAGVEGVMHIAALGSTAQRSHYSNYGTGISMCAPSSNSHEYWRLALAGRGVTTTTGLSAVTEKFGGTSSATPLSAGIAALVISANPALTGAEVISILKQTAAKDLNMTPWPRTPPASFEADVSWDISPVAPFDNGAFVNNGSGDGTWSPWFGHGKIDAQAAVRRALELGGQRTTRVSASSTTEVLIPDNQPAGAASRIAISEEGTVQSLRVFVDIAHTYIGDLVVRLIAPDGRGAYLHKRAGAGTDNIVRTFDEISAPELALLRGASVRGVWTLEIIDQASVDEGKLRQWRVEADVLGTSSLRLESISGRVIPDNNPAGITDVISVNQPLSIAELMVEVDITHTYIGDLLVELRGPNGASAMLHNRAGVGADNLQRAFRVSDTPGLDLFRGQPATGAWTLAVSDVAGQDEGKLNRWALTIA